MSISIIIPCHGNDYIFLKPLITYINNFFVDKPTCISIAISGISDEQLNDLKKHPSDISLIFTYTGSKVTAGRNRNFAIKKVNTDYILAIDSDDIPNPNIITVYKELIKKYTVNLIVSNFNYNPEVLDFKTNYSVIFDTNYIKSKTKNNKEIKCDFSVAHGSGILIKKNIFNRIHYSDKRYGEDTELCLNILKFLEIFGQ